MPVFKGHSIHLRLLLSFLIVGFIILSCGQSKGESQPSKSKKKKSAVDLNSSVAVADSLLNTSGFQVDTLADPELELARLMERYEQIKQLYSKNDSLSDSLQPLIWEICPQYWQLWKKISLLKEPVHRAIIDSLIGQPNNEKENRMFLEALIEQMGDTNMLAVESALAPIFNIKKDSLGIYIEELYATYIPEMKLLESTSYREDIQVLPYPPRTLFYKRALNSIFPDTLESYVYSLTEVYLTEVRNFGKYEDECLAYFYYDIEPPDVSENDETFLFSSPFDLDLVYENTPEVDSIINSRYPDICVDCPSSWDKQRTFARLKGYENIYFTYAYEANKELDDTDTPLRAAYYVHDNIVINIWVKEIDMFFCSCL